LSATPEQSNRVAHEVFGEHAGYRALHAKGVLLKGTFTATPEAASLTRALHMQGDSVPVTVRFSNGSGNPKAPDYAPDVRGLAVKLYLSDGSKADIVAQTAPRFPVRTPEAFLELLLAQKPGPAMAYKLPLFLARHPEAIAKLPPNVPALRPPVSYATCRYYAIHAYRFTGADGEQRYVRYTLHPEAGDHRLSPREAKRRGGDYLREEIAVRLDQGPIRFRLDLQIAEPGDTTNDPSAAWPKDRQRVTAGTLEISGRETEREQGDDILVFDPTRVVDGIECSEDPVLNFRPRAYDASVRYRTGG
jgi:catalase